MNRRPIICVDFDGVIRSYKSGWQGVNKVPDEPVKGALEWLEQMLDVPDCICSMAPRSKVQIVIYSSRSKSFRGRRAMKKWFAKWMGREFLEVLKFPIMKPPAYLTIDDRAMTFKGEFPTIKEMLDFKPWYR